MYILIIMIIIHNFYYNTVRSTKYKYFILIRKKKHDKILNYEVLLYIFKLILPFMYSFVCNIVIPYYP